MSLINDMLRDLDERNAAADSPARDRVGQLFESPASHRRWYQRPGYWGLGALGVALVGAALYGLSLTQTATFDAGARVAAPASAPPQLQPQDRPAAEPEAVADLPEASKERVAGPAQAPTQESPPQAETIENPTANAPVPSPAPPPQAPQVAEAPSEPVAKAAAPALATLTPESTTPAAVAGKATTATPKATAPRPAPAQEELPRSTIVNARRSEEQLLVAARALLEAGRQQEAERAMQRELEADPGRHRLRLMLAKSLLSHDPVAARILMEQGLALLPNHHPYRLALAYSFMRAGDYTEAARVLAAQRPTMADALDYYTTEAAVQQFLGDYAASEQTYQQLLRLQGANGRWLLGLAIAQDHRGNYQQARINYQKTLVMTDVDPQGRDYARQQLERLQRMEVESW
ncbi:tetratricopeptide repeat protein [Aestuariirhabdus litorea]|uniref:Uncharacterized protein n=1 Tax=Aestuariirhabdus litorea TaxID=2528527 RepID=A0A3P3VN98_9GAMM|nr:tetratricopeptide repeat protein [Aestuariirhabdus litorea]RRJ83116.1 hypothetical protein D0544_14855 [Aestuariirhabdus litorea]RWW93272.1 tetratricopeptide repeat protein [Endozoicomonadaceae bacterium GTF-13]